jgi:hypothetical protein
MLRLRGAAGALRAALRCDAPGSCAAASQLRGAALGGVATPAAARRIHEDRNGEMEELIERTLARASCCPLTRACVVRPAGWRTRCATSVTASLGLTTCV